MKRVKTEIYDRVSGYYRSIDNFNLGKREEVKHRKRLDVLKATKTAQSLEKTGRLI